MGYLRHSRSVDLAVFASGLTMYRSLDAQKTIETLRTLARRIEERFPGASLNGVCRELLDIARETTGRIEWMSRGHVWIRGGVLVLLALSLWLIWFVIRKVKIHTDGFEIEEVEAATNGIFLIGAAFFFLITLESRLKRHRVLSALHELRAISHVIDMHQLTKDPGQLLGQPGTTTPSSPQRTLSPFQLTRYLDYCSEMLSLVGKLAALYAQSNSDSVVLQSVNDIETLTNGISRKIWQKIMILDNDRSAALVPDDNSLHPVSMSPAESEIPPATHSPLKEHRLPLREPEKR
ncbi:MAG: hypothetical protein ACK58L_13225 [Planctomycetota bacterium]